jgi:hypothetical protein
VAGQSHDTAQFEYLLPPHAIGVLVHKPTLQRVEQATNGWKQAQ